MVRRNKFVILIALIVVCLLLISFLSLAFIVPLANPWVFSETQIDKLHRLGLDGSGVTVGLICTGVDVSHPEFDTSQFINWLDLVNGSNEPYDDVDHGTHLAGILIAQGSYDGLLSGVNLRGVAPGIQLVVVKAISLSESEFGEGNETRLAQAIQYCIEKHVDIICLGLGPHPELLFPTPSDAIIHACEQAQKMGIIIIAPAGDDGQHDDGDVTFPGTLTEVITVGSIASTGVLSSFSSAGFQYPETIHPHKKPEIVAPGESILSTRTYGSYGQFSGTCQAAVVVTGITALLLQAYHTLKENTTAEEFPTLLKEVYTSTAKQTNDMHEEYAHDDRFGYGIIQAYASYESLALYTS